MLTIALYLLLGCLGLFGLLLLWDGLVALRHTTQVVEKAVAQYQAPREALVMNESFESFCARECGMTERP
jgi:hypothetical protein